MDSIHRLEEIFAKFPGIGPRQAKRFVYYLMNKSPSSIRELVELIEEVKKTTSECSSCHRFFAEASGQRGSNRSNQILCNICSDDSRDKTVLMVVARDSDFESIEKSGAYNGRYFILGGTIPILDKEPDKRIRLEPLLNRVTNDSKSGLAEIILSLNTTPEGDNTAIIVKEALHKVIDPTRPIRISLLGRGLSTGAELEYVDRETIKSALKHRDVS